MALADSPSFADLLRRYRQRAGLTQEELAERAGLTAKGIGALERGERLRPHRDTLDRLVSVLNLAPEEQVTFAAATRRQRVERPLDGPSTRSAPTWSMQLTSFVGRTREVSSVLALLRSAGIRLVTLTGPGGVGKTRLALRVAQELTVEDFGAVYVASLASTHDPELVASAIAASLGIQAARARPLVTTLKGYLQAGRALLVLDNFEHVMGAASLVTELLLACPELSILVTSRSVLNLTGEHIFAVPPMALPQGHEASCVDTALQYDAVALFVQRARAVRTDLDLRDDSISVVADICRRLDGLPLAIELAAARIRLLPLGGLLSRLENRLQLLTGGGRDRPDRQQTLRSTIDWSYALLDEAEKTLFTRLSVFAGGCTIEAAEAVCNAGGDLEIDVLGGLTSLLDKSLLLQEGREEARFIMLQTIQEYARDRLDARGETESIQQAYAAYYLTMAEAAEPELTGPRQVTWLSRLEQEQENLRAAMQWSLERAASRAP